MLVACVANYFLFIPAVIIIGIQLLFRWFFLHTSRHVKRLEALGDGTLSSTKFLLISPLQVAVHCFLTSRPRYKACQRSGHTEKKQNSLPTFIHIKMSTPKDGICTLPVTGGLE